MQRVGLLAVWDKFPIDFTHLHTDAKSSSILDHFFVNKRLIDLVTDAGPVHLGDNLSRHSPVMMKIKLQDILARTKQPEQPRLRKPAWFKASEEEKNQYTTLLDQKLNDLAAPASLSCSDVNCKQEDHTADRDKHVIDVMCNIMECSHQCIPLSPKIKQSCKQRASNLPGWKENVAPAKKDSLFWHSVWLSAGRPAAGALQQLMSWTRNKYHYAVRKAKRLAGTIRSRRLLEAAAEGDLALMKEMKRTLNRKTYGQAIPESLDGKVTHDTILDRFRECYEELYNAAGTEDAMTTIKEKLDQMIKGNTSCLINEVEKVTGQVVKQACSRMLPGKNDVTEVWEQ